MADERMSEEECAACGSDGYHKEPRLGDDPCSECAGLGVVHEPLNDGEILRLMRLADSRIERRILAELRRERARADEAAARLDAFAREAAQLKRDRERERDIAAKREREACVAHVRRRGVESKDGMVLDVTTDIANEIEEGLHHAK